MDICSVVTTNNNVYWCIIPAPVWHTRIPLYDRVSNYNSGCRTHHYWGSAWQTGHKSLMPFVFNFEWNEWELSERGDRSSIVEHFVSSLFSYCDSILCTEHNVTSILRIHRESNVWTNIMLDNNITQLWCCIWIWYDYCLNDLGLVNFLQRALDVVQMQWCQFRCRFKGQWYFF